MTNPEINNNDHFFTSANNINNTKFIIIVVGMNCQKFVVPDVLKLTMPIPGAVMQIRKIQTDRKL